MPRLIDSRTGEQRELLKPVTLIGRAEYCDVCVPERTVSREHARIRRRLTGTYLEDLGSTHGIHVNGVRVRGSVKLRDGDALAIGALPSDRPTRTVSAPHFDTAVSTEESPREAPAEPADAAPARGAAFVFRK